ncbi:hypothetical protein PSTT_15606 [Puccinia striiformis]|uniref:Uncharacterized protein n=1 Tax=Puccinia striiformis TaxID=27350 RepID=A0A2S4UGR7_9BASI|nr:hypothetical protein PSTT_15606 [Puccinia striiformis]
MLPYLITLGSSSLPGSTKKAIVLPKKNQTLRLQEVNANLFEWPNVNILADMQELLQAAGISLQPRQVTFKRFNVTYDFSEFPPSPTRSVEMDPDDLCCFCDEILPKNPSAAFLKANKKLRALPEVRARNKSKNPSALYLPFPQRAEHCQLHQAELPPYLMELIEDGPRRLTLAHTKHAAFKTNLPPFKWNNPGSSYGPPGYRHITQALNDLFKPSPAVQSAPPLNHECLIAEDLGVSVSDESVMCVLEESRLFGGIVFPIPDEE